MCSTESKASEICGEDNLTYNDQVATIRAALAADPATADVRVGSVDKFRQKLRAWWWR